MYQRKVVNYTDLFGNLRLHSRAISHFISRSFYNCYDYTAFFYPGSVDELTHSRELCEAVTQAFTTNRHFLKRAEWIELCK